MQSSHDRFGNHRPGGAPKPLPLVFSSTPKKTHPRQQKAECRAAATENKKQLQHQKKMSRLNNSKKRKKKRKTTI